MSHSLTFFWGEATAISNMALEFMINFSTYPDKIYAPAIRALMYSILPSALAVHVPLRFIAGFSPGLFAAAFLGAAVYMCLSAGLFYLGLRRYESGNAIGMKS
jgi:ABC-2 type transport system permease protein